MIITIKKGGAMFSPLWLVPAGHIPSAFVHYCITSSGGPRLRHLYVHYIYIYLYSLYMLGILENDVPISLPLQPIFYYTRPGVSVVCVCCCWAATCEGLHDAPVEACHLPQSLSEDHKKGVSPSDCARYSSMSKVPEDEVLGMFFREFEACVQKPSWPKHSPGDSATTVYLVFRSVWCVLYWSWKAKRQVMPTKSDQKGTGITHKNPSPKHFKATTGLNKVTPTHRNIYPTNHHLWMIFPFSVVESHKPSGNQTWLETATFTDDFPSFTLVNVYITMERSTMLFMGKSTSSTGPFSSSQTVNVYQGVSLQCGDFPAVSVSPPAEASHALLHPPWYRWLWQRYASCEAPCDGHSLGWGGDSYSWWVCKWRNWGHFAGYALFSCETWLLLDAVGGF